MSNRPAVISTLKWLAAALLVIATVVVVRTFCVESYRISTASMQPVLNAGDRILVNKLTQKGNPGRNRVVLYHSPLLKDSISQPLFVGRCIGMPGDTLQLSGTGFPVSGQQTASYSFVVPRKNRPYLLTNASLTACREAILREASSKAVFRDEKLYVDGREASFFVFRQDYYWILGDNPDKAIDSRHLGLIPADCLVGNAWFCWFSMDGKHVFKPVH